MVPNHQPVMVQPHPSTSPSAMRPLHLCAARREVQLTEAGAVEASLGGDGGVQQRPTEGPVLGEAQGFEQHTLLVGGG